KVYERAGANRYVLTIDPKGARIDDVSDTDGIEVTSCATSRPFAQGVFIVQDGQNAGGNQNFKLYAWVDIAGTSLLIDTTCRDRRQGSEAPVCSVPRRGSAAACGDAAPLASWRGRG